MDPILNLAQARGLYVVEDCAQAHGATYKGRPVGSLGDVGAFSFCQDKIFTTAGEGGMLVTQDQKVWQRAWEFKDHGKNVEKLSQPEPSNRFRFVHDSFGTNWRMTEVQAAIGRVALGKLAGWVEKRRNLASLLTSRLSRLRGLRVGVPGPDFGHSYYKYYAFVRPEQLAPGWNRDRILEAICAEGVPCYSGICSEIYLEKAFPEEWRPASRLPNAQLLGETSLMFLVHPTLTASDIEDVADGIEKVMLRAADTKSE
jgi:Predicted pyridoxal phosphate-dependent enzyme apparently involved in regulation of cell wall biogenesis